ncbi:MAG: right-handed parallel beta-helix repeat-containing protein, partial [Anaerolineae bacterium]|nr:right-handed parallel beta-helix repeat-containing protein [Anaerolineae bacterium]
IRRNVFQGNAASGLQVNADPQTAAEEVFYYLQNTTGDTCGINEDDLWATEWHVVADCYTAQGLPDLGPYFEDGISERLIIEQNIITGNGAYGGAGINLASVRHSSVRNNLIYGNAAAAIACWDNAYAEDTGVAPSPFGCDAVTINNNTMLDLGGGRGALILNQGAANMAVFNNIIVRDRFDAYEVAFNSGTNLHSAYNAYFAQFVEESPGSLMLDTHPDSGSLTGFTVQEALAQFVNPDFTPWLRLDAPYPELNPARPDFHLQPDATWAGAGNPDLSAPLDLFGVPRTGTELGALTVGGVHATRVLPATSPASLLVSAPGPIPGVITYLLADDGHIYRIAAEEDAVPEDITAALDALYPGPAEEAWLNVSPDGAWLLTESERFDPACVGWACLVLLSADLSVVDVPLANDAVIHVEGSAAVSTGAAAIVYVADGGPHTRDLWAVFRAGDAWDGPLLLTGDSPFAHHSHPAISADGTRVVFDCHDAPYASAGSSLCMVNLDGTGFTVLLTPEDAPAGAGEGIQLHHPDFAPDGSIVFEADWGGERLWRLAPGATDPTLITDQFGNDNSPCVLADGRFASLWLDREGGDGVHELKIMSADGATHEMLLTGVDVFDVGLGCGG